MGQVKVVSNYYSMKDGLPQNTVSDIAKDKSGFMWIATKNGLCRFDGYDFVNYKVSSNEFHCSVNNDFQQIVIGEDELIWLRNTLGQVVCFNPITHKFTLYPNVEKNRGENYIYVNRIKKLNNGDLWLIDDGGGCVRVRKKGNKYEETFYNNLKKFGIGNHVIDIYEDRTSHVWLLTELGIGLVSGTNIVNYKRELYEPVIGCIETTNSLFFLCENNKFFVIDRLKKRNYAKIINQSATIKKCFYCKSNGSIITVLSNGSVAVLDEQLNVSKTVPNSVNTKLQNAWIDYNGDIWIKLYGNTNLFRFDSNGLLLSSLPINISDDVVSHLCEDSDFGFVVTDGENTFAIPSKDRWYEGKGMNIYKHYFSGDNSNIQFEKLFTDNEGIYWGGSGNKGLHKCVTLNSSFRFYDLLLAKGTNNRVSAVLEDKRHRIWIATQNGYLALYSQDYQCVGFVSSSGTLNKNKSKFGYVSSIFEDRTGNIWLGQKHCCSQLIPVENNFIVKNYAFSPESPSQTTVTDILEDSKGRLWLTTDCDGLQMLQISNEGFRYINRHNELKTSYPPTVLKTNCLYEDSDGDIWLGSTEGVTVFPVDFPNFRFLKFFFYNSENSDMENCNISDVYQDSDGILWFSSYGGGIFKISKKFELGETPVMQGYTIPNNQFNSGLALSILEDNNRYNWLLTENSLTKYNEKGGKSEFFGYVSGLFKSGFSRNAFIKGYSGSFILGAEDGFYVINPNLLKTSLYSPKIVFTRLQVFNKDVLLGEKDSPVPVDVDKTQSIDLLPGQSVFSIEFAALDYRNSDQIQYAYKLEGFEQSWNYVGNKRVATYTNLPPGTYILKVKSTNSEGNWCNNERTITINVHPSFTQTIWAKMLLVILLLTVILAVLYFYLKFYKIKSNIKLEKEMSDIKMQFFTDISHELRTPLTLINGPIENLLKNGNLNTEEREQLEIAQNNSSKMLRMLSQVLDIRKLQSKKMHLKVAKLVVSDIVKSCCGNFKKLAESRDIQFDYFDESDKACYWVDKDKLDTVMFNLLSNAFKFTPQGKRITVKTSINGKNLNIIVADEGCGMAENQQKNIFERFVTIRDKSLTNQAGTGIGLALVKEILDLHGATISVVSREGEGSTFTVSLLPGTSHFPNDTEFEVDDDLRPDTQDSPVNIKDEDEDKTKILLVEDNQDLRTFIVSVLKKKYVVYEAENGEIGLKKIKETAVDLVISDIMMPVMDGVELVRCIRNDAQVSHIPIILLTAKTDIEGKIDCLNLGVNDYITKPFSVLYLEARIDNLLTERRKWQSAYRQQLLTEFTNGTVKTQSADSNDDKINDVSPIDDEFMGQLLEYISNNLENAELTLENIADGLKISRWTLTSKVKSLVGQTPVEFVRDVRLSKAAELIDEGKFNMTQITYMIGMTDSRYFSRCFKQKYGLSPTEYKNREKN